MAKGETMGVQKEDTVDHREFFYKEVDQCLIKVYGYHVFCNYLTNLRGIIVEDRVYNMC